MPRRHSPDAAPGVVLLQLTQFAQSLLQQNTLDDLLWHITSKVGELFGFEDCVLYLHEELGLVQSAAHGVKSPGLREIRNRIVLPLGRGIVGSVAASGRAECIADTRKDPRYIADEFQGRSELAVPISYGGRILGVIDSESSQPSGFSADDQAVFELVAMLAAPRIASALAERGLLRAEEHLQRLEAEQGERERQHHTQRLESLGQLAGGIAHDFNNLLTAIFGNVALARSEVTSTEVGEMLDEASAACVRARGLTKQLLTFASGGQPIHTVGDLVPMLRSVVLEVAQPLGLQVVFDVPNASLLASFDQDQLRLVIRHLTRNAAEAEAGGGSLRIRARHELRGGRQVVEVRWHDTGPGVPTELRERIFDPYFTTKVGHSGLGLSQSFWILRRHGGWLELESEVERGACLVMRLPAVAAVPVGLASAKAIAASGLRVLVMDDDHAVRQVVVRMLQGMGHDVVAVADGVACVTAFTTAMAAGQGFDVALLDLTLPGGMDGCQTLAALRQVAPGLPAVVVSGYHDTGALAEPQVHGFYACLEKPFTRSALQAAIGEAIAHRRSSSR